MDGLYSIISVSSFFTLNQPDRLSQDFMRYDAKWCDAKWYDAKWCHTKLGISAALYANDVFLKNSHNSKQIFTKI